MERNKNVTIIYIDNQRIYQQNIKIIVYQGDWR